MTEQEIKSSNKMIAEFMGYVYFEENVLVDYSDIGGVYDNVNVYSKVPIEVKDYGEGQKYFASLPNPDFGNEKSERWASDIEKLGWDTLNSGNYLTDLKYHDSWNWLMPVLEKIESLGYHTKICFDDFGTWTQIHYGISVADSIETKALNQHGTKFENTFNSVVEFIKWYNKNGKKPKIKK